MKNTLSFSCFILLLFGSCSDYNYDPSQFLKSSLSTVDKVSNAEEVAVTAAAMDYIECFYEADTTKAYRSVSPLLQKRGYGFSKKKNQYSEQYEMNFEQLIALAKKWNADGSRLNDKSPKKVEIYEIMDKTAPAKVYAQWGTDYMHLSKIDGKWYVMNVLWQSYPPED